MAKIVKSNPDASNKNLENSQPGVNNTRTPAVLRIVKHLDDPTGPSKGNTKTDGITKKTEGCRSGPSQLIEENKEAGYYTTEFDGSNLSSGVYFYKLEAGTFNDVKRMVLI